MPEVNPYVLMGSETTVLGSIARVELIAIVAMVMRVNAAFILY
jgi:hypothetical protein